jgi:hypothetical protein
MADVEPLVESWWAFGSAVLNECTELDCELAGWYLSPGQHLVEAIATNMLLIVMLYFSWPKTAKTTAITNSTTATTTATTTDSSTSSTHWTPRNNGRRSLLDWMLLAITTCSLLMVVYHKQQESRMWFLLQPCHTLQALIIVTMLLGSRSRVAVLLFNLYLGMFFSPFLGMVAADPSVYTQWMEYESWAVQHALLCLLPFFFIATRRFPVIKSLRFVVFAFTLEMFFHFAILLPLSIFSGFNLNYMMCPPAGPLTLFNAYYRPVMSAACLGMAMAFSYLVFIPFTRLCRIDMYSVLPIVATDNNNKKKA